MKYIFFGTPQFAVIILDALIETGLMPALIVTAPDKPKGRGNVITPPPVKMLSEENSIPVAQPTTLKNNQKLINAITAINPDLFIVAAYGKIIPKSLLDIPRKGAINVHPSLLPKYRGPSPIQAAILNGDETTGVTIMLMDEEMDHGPILAQTESNIQCSPKTLNVGRCLTAKELSEKLAHLGAQLLIKTISKWLAGDPPAGGLTPQEQDHTKATYTKMITKEDGHIDWHKSAKEIERMVRAYTPWPSAWTILKQNEKESRIKILNVVPIDAPGASIEAPGTIIKQKSDMIVACGEGFLHIEKLQVEGGKPMSGEEFLRGFPLVSFFLQHENAYLPHK